MVLDEPTSGLDPAGRTVMLSILRHLSRDLRIQVLPSSHVLEDIERTCDEVVVLAGGRLTAQQAVARGESGGPVSLQVTGDASAFAALLREQGVLATVESGRVLLAAASARELDLVRDLAASSGTGVLSLVDAANVLDDAVVGAMG